MDQRPPPGTTAGALPAPRFTLSHELNEWCRYKTRLCYDLLFRTAWRTLKKFGRDPRWPGADVGATMVLHTWGQNLSLHPHVHCIVPSGGLDGDKWVRPKRSGKSGFLFPVKAMSKFFRGRFLTALVEAWHEGKLVRPPAVDFTRRRSQTLVPTAVEKALGGVRQSAI